MATAGESVLLRSELDPITLGALDSFRRRRAALLLLRALGAGVLAFISLAMVLATIDYLAIVPDPLRWAASISIYVITALTMWFSGLAELRKRDPIDIARHLESVAPQLREDLVSAVELAAPESTNGSAYFRRLLQSRVAKRVAAVDISGALPLALVRRWVLSGGVVAAVCVALLFIPAAQFGRRFARAALPGVPIERASRTKVTIVAPSPASGYVAERDAVGVIASVEGAEPEDVMLHWRAEDGTFGESLMTPRMNAGDFVPGGEGAATASAENPEEVETGVRFAANLSVGSLPIEYRITAGDAVTLWHELTPLPRPRVLRYQKRYRYPAYAKLQDRVAEEEHGDLKALQGTTAEVTVTFDQPVENPVVRFGVRGTRNVMQPVDESGTQFLAKLSIKTSGQYQVDATSMQSGLNNPFTPTNTITPVLDTPPVIRFDDKITQSRVVSALDVVELSAVATDDLPLDRVVQEVQVNGGSFQGYELKIDSPAKQLELDWQWDLLDRLGETIETDKLRVGDLVQTRLVAIDRRGARSESETLGFLIADDGFDADRHAFLKGFSQQSRQVIDWTVAVKQVAESVEQMTKTQEFDGLAETTDRWQDLQRESVGLIRSLSGSLAATQNTANASVTQLIGEAILDIDTRLEGQLRQSQWLAERDETAGKGNRTKACKDLSRAANRAAYQCERLNEFVRARFANAFTAAMYADVLSLKHSVKQLVQSLPPQRLPRYLTLLRGQFAEIDQLVSSYETLLPDKTINHLHGSNWSKFSQDWILQLETVLEQNGRRDQVLAILKSLDDQIKEKPQHVIDSGNRNTLLRFGRDLRKENQYLADLVRDLNDAGQRVEREQAKVKIEREADQAALRGLDATLAELQWQTALNRLIVRAAGQERLNRDAVEVDLKYAADQALFLRAIKNVTEDGFVAYREQPPREVFDAVGDAIAVLQGASEVAATQDDLLAIREGEQQPDDAPLRKFYHPVWFQLQPPRIELAVRYLRNAGVDRQDPLQSIDSVRHNDDYQAANARLDSRVWRLDPFLSAAQPLQAMADQLRRGLASLETSREEARQTLRRYVLTLSEQARNAAEETRQAERQTEQRPEASEATRAELRPQQDRSVEKATETIGALIDRANTSGILDQQQRDVARDADAAAELISEAVRQTKEALKQSEKAPNSESRDDALESVERKLGALAGRLEQTAEHFEKLENGEDVTESREQLRQDEQQLQNAAALDERYQQATQMAETAAQDPRELLRQLEEELRRNQPMQQALSDIADGLVDNATETLQQASRDETELQRRLENEDTAFREQMRQKQYLLEEMVMRAKTLSDQTLQTASRTAGWANQPEIRDQVEATREQLRQAAEHARQATSGNPTTAELSETVERLRDELQKAATAAERSAKQFSEQAEADIHQEQVKRNDSARAMNRTRNQLRNDELKAIDQQRRQWNNVEKSAGSRIRSAETKQRAAENRLQRDEQRLKDDPDNESLQREVDRSRDHFEQAQATAKNARQTRELARQRREQANERVNEINAARSAPLDKPNPAAELGAEIAQSAQQRLQGLSEELRRLTGQQKPDETLKATSDSARSVAEQQQRVQRDVLSAAEDLSRASRHENRLERSENAQQLSQAAEQTRSKAGEAAEQATQQLQQASEDNARSSAASEGLQQAAETIGEQADRLRNRFGQKQGQPSPSANPSSSAESPSSSETAEQDGTPQSQPLPGADPSQSPTPAPTPASASAQDSQSGSSTGSSPSSPASPSPASPSPASPSPASPSPASPSSSAASPGAGQASIGETSDPQQMAQTLDDLDQALAALSSSRQGSPSPDPANASEQADQSGSQKSPSEGQGNDPQQQAGGDPASQAGDPSGPSDGTPQNALQASPTLAQMLEAQLQQAARERMQSLQQAQQAGQPNGESSDSDGSPDPMSESGQGDVPDAPDGVNLLGGDIADGAWGELRERGVEDAAQGRGARIPPGYAREIQAYFKALSRRAAESKP